VKRLGGKQLAMSKRTRKYEPALRYLALYDRLEEYWICLSYELSCKDLLFETVSSLWTSTDVLDARDVTDRDIKNLRKFYLGPKKPEEYYSILNMKTITSASIEKWKNCPLCTKILHEPIEDMESPPAFDLEEHITKSAEKGMLTVTSLSNAFHCNCKHTKTVSRKDLGLDAVYKRIRLHLKGEK
jgi:hypothetical protein